jgi:hypothetical protein
VRDEFRRIRVAVGLLAVVLLIGTAVAVLAVRSREDEPAPSRLAFPNDSPIHGGRIVDLATAEAETPFALPVPHSDVANPDTLINVWSEPKAHEAAPVYRSDGGEVVLDLYPTILLDPRAAFQQEIDLDVSDASIVEIGGAPALLTEPGSDVPGTNPASLRFVHDGVEVLILSSELSADELVDIARSLEFPGDET